MKTKSNITRRDFICKSAIAASAPLVLNFTHNSFAKQSKETINVGIIGVGSRGQNAHIRTLLKFPDVKIAAICDIKEKRLEEALEKAGTHKPRTYRDYEALLKQKDLDCVFVSTPPDKHKIMVCDALRAGFSVYVDKPMTLTVTDCNAIGRAIKNAKGVFIVGQQLRYNFFLRKKIEAIHNGKIGKVVLINYKVFRGPGRLPDGSEPDKK